MRHFIVFEDSAAAAGGGQLIKKMAGYHQFHAVNVAVEETLRAAQVQAAAFDELDAPVARVGAPFAPIPFSPPLEDAYLPGREEVTAAVRATLGRAR